MNLILGSYGTLPRPLQGPEDFDVLTERAVRIEGVTGLEAPFMEASSPWRDAALLARLAGDHVLTTIPAVMSAVERDPRVGPAAVDEEGRAAALRILRAACEFVRDVNADGEGRISTVQVHSAPGRGASSADAFARTLDEVRDWDWSGAELAVEHCDALRGDHPPAKGFLSLEEEIALCAERGIGTVVNWGRSAIETRDADGPAAHILAAREAGTLVGVVFSGCADADGPYGAAFDDRHVPMRGWGDGPLAAAADASLLTRDEVARCVGLALDAPGLRYLGVKVKAPAGSGPEDWAPFLEAHVRAVARAADGVAVVG